MEHSEYVEAINAIFIDVLDDEEISIQGETSADDVEDWDSLTHIELVVAVEKKFVIRFSSKEIQSWKNVNEMISCIIEKKG